MESVAGPRAAKPGAAASLDFGEIPLRGERARVILWMRECELAESEMRRRLARGIEADEQRLAVVDALQPVHPVGHGDVVLGRRFALPAQEVPGCPCIAAFRHKIDVAVQIGRVWSVTDRAENGSLAWVGIRQHRQGLIAVTGHHDSVVGVLMAVTVADRHTVLGSMDRRHRAAEPDAGLEPGREFLDIAPAAALHGPPERSI